MTHVNILFKNLYIKFPIKTITVGIIVAPTNKCQFPSVKDLRIKEANIRQNN